MNLPVKKLTELAKEYQINLMILFGSYLTENYNENSDIDLAIQVDDINLIKTERLKILNQISALFNYHEIDLVLLNYADPLLKFNIACDGKLIYEKKSGLFNIFKVRAMSEHHDAKKFYQLDKKFIKNYLAKENKHGKSRVSPPQID